MQTLFFYLYLLTGIGIFIYGTRDLNTAADRKADPVSTVITYLLLGTGYMLLWPLPIIGLFYTAFKNRSKS